MSKQYEDAKANCTIKGYQLILEKGKEPIEIFNGVRFNARTKEPLDQPKVEPKKVDSK